MKPLLQDGYVLFHDKPTPRLLTKELKKEGCIGWCQCGEPAFIRLHGRIACLDCTQEAVAHADYFSPASSSIAVSVARPLSVSV
jgi:hypothetical protein